MKKVNNKDMTLAEYIGARKDYLGELDFILMTEFNLKKKKKQLLSDMKEWDKKLLLV